jgi:hypothetical protein
MWQLIVVITPNHEALFRRVLEHVPCLRLLGCRRPSGPAYVTFPRAEGATEGRPSSFVLHIPPLLGLPVRAASRLSAYGDAIYRPGSYSGALQWLLTQPGPISSDTASD